MAKLSDEEVRKTLKIGS